VLRKSENYALHLISLSCFCVTNGLFLVRLTIYVFHEFLAFLPTYFPLGILDPLQLHFNAKILSTICQGYKPQCIVSSTSQQSHKECIISFLYCRYYRANSVKIHHTTEGCDAGCAHTHYCAITRLDYPEFRSCLETAASALASAGVIALSIHWSLLVLLLLALVHALAQSILMPSLGSLHYS
jgi:hypothetical protein